MSNARCACTLDIAKQLTIGRTDGQGNYKSFESLKIVFAVNFKTFGSQLLWVNLPNISHHTCFFQFWAGAGIPSLVSFLILTSITCKILTTITSEKDLDLREIHPPLATGIFGLRADQRNERRWQADGFEGKSYRLGKCWIPYWENKEGVVLREVLQGLFFTGPTQHKLME